MNDNSMKAFGLAKEAASLDFASAISGIIAGHKAEMDRMRDDLAASDMAMLMALALSEKGSRVDRDGVASEKIISRISKINMSNTEKNFIENHEGKSQ